MDIKKIKAVVFDLGNVIVDLDVNATIEGFRQLPGNENTITCEDLESELFLQYEKGLISSDDFRKGIRLSLKKEMSDQQIDAAWNAMLVDTPLKRLSFMHSLRTQYKVFVLSNTNAIHVDCFEQQIALNSNGKGLRDHCDKIYYSHIMNMRKPNADIYAAMIADIGLPADQILFLDDKAENIAAAHKAGIQAIQITQPDMIFTIL